MRPVEMKPDVFWVGAVDWSSRDFHGYSRSPRGTTYNAYLIKDEKTTLFDTVKADHAGELLCSISHLVNPEEIDYIVVNHLEPDHAGALPQIIERCKPEKIFVSPMGERALKAHFHDKDWPVEVVKSGDTINIGKRDIHFVETRMLHWPDSMCSYVAQDKLMITNDIFGQNIASSVRYADEVERDILFNAAKEYYANIVLPYSAVTLKTLDALAEMKLDIDMIAPDHGLIFRGKEDVSYIIDLYRKFAEQKPAKKAVIVYDSMWHSTEKMAAAIGSGLTEGGIVVKQMWMKANHHSAVMTEVWDAAAVIVGSPTHNNGIMPLVAAMLTYMKGLRPQNKIGVAFGSFGWSGECVKIISDWLEQMGMEMPEEAIKCKNVPTHEDLSKCYQLGLRLQN